MKQPEKEEKKGKKEESALRHQPSSFAAR